MNHWLLKTEPETYSWDTLVREKECVWDGVRNHQARQNLEKMKKGDLVYIYHTGNEKAIVGTATITKGPFPEAGAEKWTSIKLKPVKKLKSPVSLSSIKSDKRLAEISLVKMSRLSVQSLSKEEFDLILGLSEPS
jgi:predicted RNA-binding protein with PUA-like domain